MPTYQCCFLDANEQTVRTEVLRSRDEVDAHREAVTLMMRVGGFAGYELWAEGRKIAEHRPIEESGTSAR
jgi:hypothetical protein